MGYEKHACVVIVVVVVVVIVVVVVVVVVVGSILSSNIDKMISLGCITNVSCTCIMTKLGLGLFQ